jgi:hypothetical protein
MNRKQRRAAAANARGDFTPVARQLAQKLAARCPEDDWALRYVMFTAGVQQIASFCPPQRHAELEGMVGLYARCVVEAFAAPPIATPEQMAIWHWAGPDCQRQAVEWLRAQGGQTVIRRLDGVDIDLTLDDASGEIRGRLWPIAEGQA